MRTITGIRDIDKIIVDQIELYEDGVYGCSKQIAALNAAERIFTTIQIPQLHKLLQWMTMYVMDKEV